MKNIFTNISYILCISILMMLGGCNKDISLNEVHPQLNSLDQDLNAGSWRMKVLNAPDQIVVPSPSAETSAEYKAELENIKNLQKGLTKAQKETIAFWSIGGVLRWNMILRELVARYNLPPAPKADGTYPAPDPENPFSDPAFPFSNPPYAARAYSYVSVGQYEALKAAWHYKFLYQRNSPAQIDNSIQALVPISELPAYPSEDAVISGVTAEMLKFLFPAAVEEITKYAADQRNAAIWSGKASTSDVSAGLALGKSVAGMMLNRARTDGMGAAIGNPALWKQLEENVGFGNLSVSNQIPWMSLESPKRPPMLPNFGNVLAWNMTANQISTERPALPPGTSSEKMKQELDEVLWFSNNLTRERLAIVHKWADGVGTYTPPGHWNAIAATFISGARFSEVRAARAFALLNMAIHDAGVACWETKFYYFNPRPSQLSPAIKTCTGVPNFPAYTSGHSTFSGAAATVLSYLFPEGKAFFEEQAQEASLSRLYGGIHYRSDCEAGLTHGKVVGAYTVQYANTEGVN